MRAALKWTGGTNLLVDLGSIGDNQVSLSKNSFPSLEGLLDKREVVKAVGSIKPGRRDTDTVIKPITLFNPDPILGLDFVLHGTYGVDQGEFFTIVNMDQVMALGSSDKSTYFNVGINDFLGPASFVNYRGRVIGVAGGVEGFAQLYRRQDGSYYWTRVSFNWPSTTTGVVAEQTQSIPVHPRVVGTYRGRLVFANFGPGKENLLIFADVDAQTDWTNIDNAPPWAIVGPDVLAANGRNVELTSVQGETIIGVREVSLQATGSPYQSALLVLTNKSALICTGEVAQTTDTEFDSAQGYLGDFVANKVNYDVGLVGPNAMCSTPYGLCWASNDDVWMMVGNVITPIGTLIRPALRATPPNLRRYWSMAYANGIVFLSVCTQSSGSERSLRIQHWRLDLRMGRPENFTEAKWYGPQDYENLPTNAGPNSVMCSSVVTKPGEGDKDIVYGAISVAGLGNAGGAGPGSNDERTFFITFNDATGGIDVPYPDIRTARSWSPSDYTEGNTVQVGDFIRPSAIHSNGRLYVCLVSGVPGENEPTWPIGAGDEVADGGVTWAEIQTYSIWNRLVSYFGDDRDDANLMDVYFKEFDFKVAMRDKIIRRADISAYVDTKTLLSIRCIIERGDHVALLGPVVMGEPQITGSYRSSLETYGAGNQLGLGLLDRMANTRTFQNRMLRPGRTTAALAADLRVGWTTGDSAPAYYGGVIRGHNVQPRFVDDDGIVIDSSNDYISWCSYKTYPTPTIGTVFTAQLTQGRYANIPALIDHIITKMNAAQALTVIGFTISANPWSTASAFTGLDPYMTTIKFSFDSRSFHQEQAGPPVKDAGMAFLFGYPDVANDSVVLNDVTCYPMQTKRLLAILGYDTSSDYTDAIHIEEAFSDGSVVQIVGEPQAYTTSPAGIYGIQVIPYTRSPVISISDIELDYYVKPGLPFSKRSR